MPTKTGKPPRLHPQAITAGTELTKEGQQMEIISVSPITKALRDHVEAVVLEKYQDTVKKKNG